MKLTIVYDNEIYVKDIGLKSDWGFSCVIEKEDETIFFDTGANGKILLHNMKNLGINPKNIDKIVISHEHWDHKGGLKSLAPYIKDAEVYHLGREVPSEKMISINPEIPEKISEDIWTTGRLKGLVDEQSLVLKSKNVWYLLTGCSHPGVEKILQAAKQIGDIVGIVGGLHGFNKFSVLEGLNLICPCHCTAHKQDLQRAFPDITSNCGVGKIIDLNEEI